MTDAEVVMTVRKASDSSSVNDISGEISATAENALMDAYTEASAKGTRAIILNFERLEYKNSSGIGLLVTLLIRANRQGQSLLATGLSEHYRHIFQLTRLDEAIRIFGNESEAVEAARA